MGSHLCKRLHSEGHVIVCVDNFHTGDGENLAELTESERFEKIDHDICQFLDIAVDKIYNLACPASPAHYQSNMGKTIKTNVLGAMNLLELAKNKHAKIFQASTSEVYGDPLVHPQTESYWGNVNPFGPRSCYDEGKRCAESLFYSYHLQDGVPIKIARIFNTYGPGMSLDDGRVVSNFIVQALQNKDITVYGDGSQTRSFCYVDDLIEGFIRLMESRDELTGPVNLGNPKEFTVLELANLIRDMTGSSSEIIFHPPLTDDPVRRNPDIALAKKELDWSPAVPLDKGLGKTIAYFNNKLKEAVIF